MRIPESEELARLTELYGETDGRKRLAERKQERARIKPWVQSGMSLKRICRKLAAIRDPDCFAWWKKRS